MNAEQPWAEAVAINNGQFEVVGSNEDALAAAGDHTKVVDLGGAFAMPGMIDSHMHGLVTGLDRSYFTFSDPNDADAILADVKAFADANPDVPVIWSGTWNLGAFENDSPRKELLDAIVPDRPVYLLSQTGHSAWVNSKALEMGGITKDTPNGGKFLFDADQETGEPTGTIREFAMAPVIQAIRPNDVERVAETQAKVFPEFSEHGFTSLKLAEGDPLVVEAANIIDRRGDLTTRLFSSWEWESHYMPVTKEEMRKAIDNWQSYETGLVKPTAVKMFFDGAPDSYTAYLFEDYVGRPGFRGQTNLPIDEFEELVLDFNRAGVGVIVHVIGDAGSHELVQLFQRVRDEIGPEGPLLHFSHAWMTRSEEFEALSKIPGVCLDFSPALAYPAEEISGSMGPPIGERYQEFYKVKTAIEAFSATKGNTNVAIGFGSDWPSALIPEPNGFHQMQSWITRIDPEDPESAALNPSEAITLEQAIFGFTQGSAHCLGRGWEDKVGSIEVGKLADFIVLNRDPFEAPIEELWKTEVERTVLAGRLVYDRTFDVVEGVIDERTFNPGTRYTNED